MTTLANQKKIIHEEYLQNCVYFFNGATFKVNRELINFVKTLIDLGHSDSVLIDDNNFPIDVADLTTFLESILSVYASATNAYQTQYQKIKDSRSVESLLDL
jgi:adenosine/AMP kinase